MIREFQKENRWLSNFAPCKVFYEGLVYSSVENAYQAAKTDNVEDRYNISLMSSGEAKRFSRTLVLREDWEEMKLKVMEELLCIKFSQEPYITKLLNTGNCQIQEGNYWGDKFWGVCLKTDKGENNLGKIIMDIRDRIKTIRGDN